MKKDILSYRCEKRNFYQKVKNHTKITNFYIKNEIFSQKTIQNVSKIKKFLQKCDKTYKKSLEKCERK